MNRARVVIAILATLLVVSNAYWFHQLVDAGITLSYRDDVLRHHHEALAQALAILPVAASLDSTPAEVVAAAREAAQSTDPFEKEGYLWVGELGLRFDANGRLKAVEPNWSPF